MMVISARVKAAAQIMDVDKYFRENPEAFEKTTNACLFHPGEECPLVCKKDLILVPSSGFRPLHHLLASPQCVPWAPNGANLGLSDPDVETFFQLAHQIRHEDPDMATIEEKHAKAFAHGEGRAEIPIR